MSTEEEEQFFGSLISSIHEEDLGETEEQATRPRLSPAQEIDALHQLSSILERHEIIYNETTVDPLQDTRHSYFIGKLFKQVKDEFMDYILDQILTDSSDENLLSARLRFLCALSPILGTYHFSVQDLLPTLLTWVKDGQGAKRAYATSLLSVAMVNEPSVVLDVIKSDMMLVLLKRLQDYVAAKLKRPKFIIKPKGDSRPMTKDEVEYTEMRSILHCLSNMGDYQEVVAPFFQLDGIETVSVLLNTKDKFILLDNMRFMCALLAHSKVAHALLDKGCIKQLLKLPKIPYLLGGIGVCLVGVITLTPIMEKLTSSNQYMDKFVEYGMMLLESPSVETKISGCIFFHTGLSYRAILTRFEKKDGMNALLNVIRIPVSFPDESEKGKGRLANFALLALLSYYRIQIAIGSLHLSKKTQKELNKKLNKSFEVHKFTSNRGLVDQYIQSNPLGLQQMLSRTRWKPAEQLLEAKGIQLLLETINVSAAWSSRQVLFTTLEILHIVSFAPFTHVPLCEVTVDERPGIRIIFDSISYSEEHNAKVAALEIICNLVYRYTSPDITLPAEPTTPGTEAKSKKQQLATPTKQDEPMVKEWQRVCSNVRANEGIRILLTLLKFNTPSHADVIRHLSCKSLVGLAMDATINQILRKMDVGSWLPDLVKEPVNSQNAQDFLRFREYAIQLIATTTGRAPKTVSLEARDPALVRLEKAAIVSSTQITYNEKELLQLIHEYLESKGLKKTAQSLLTEANIEPAPQEITQYQQLQQLFASPTKSTARPPTTKEQEPTSPTTPLQKEKISKKQKRKNARAALQIQPLQIPPPPQANPRLDKIVVSYLRHQHRECDNPISVLPPLSLFKTHRCPDIQPESQKQHIGNIASRLFLRQEHSFTSRRSVLSSAKSFDRKFMYSRFRHYRTEILENTQLHCTAFNSTGQKFYCGSLEGELHVYDTNHIEQDKEENVRNPYHQMYELNNGIYGLRVSPTGRHLITWHNDTCCLWPSNSKTFGQPQHEFINSSCAVFSTKGDRTVVTSWEGMQTVVQIYDIETGVKTCSLAEPKNRDFADFNIACINPYDDLVLSNAILWDIRSPPSIIHMFDKFSDANGYFHPAGNEVIIGSEVWDLRTFKLISSCSALNNCRNLTFSARGDIIFTTYRSSNKDPSDITNMSSESVSETMFRTLDSLTYETVTSFDTNKKVMDLDVDANGLYISTILKDTSTRETSCKLFEIGRKRANYWDEEDEGDDDDDDRDEEDEDEDEHDNGELIDEDDDMFEFADDDEWEELELEDGGFMSDDYDEEDDVDE